MPRPPKRRRVAFAPGVTYFKPAGIPLRRLEEVRLGVDELEAMRLKDVAGLDQAQCAAEMAISPSTLQRVLASARAKVSEALVLGKAIRIEGGQVQVCGAQSPCDAGAPRRHRRRHGRGPGPKDEA